jgi:hypothetical protein
VVHLSVSLSVSLSSSLVDVDDKEVSTEDFVLILL